MAERGASPKRCAIYTRKSSEEGLEQDFNSLHAQREACEAFIASQRHEGWQLIPSCYDDGGYSGGTLGRPALTRLLADLQSGLIDIVVVYKVDRLTRALSDFAKIVDILDRQNASFVSVTQAFNTTTSMGRLTLNVLLSFAQFEREVTGERIRDKIAASKKKGLWMGGFVPMGYAAQGRTLVPVEEEARLVRLIFTRYLALGSVGLLAEELVRDGYRTPASTSQSRRHWGERPFSRGHLYRILSNPLYVGDIAHRGQRHRGQHPALIDTETFDAVAAKLAGSRGQRRVGANTREPSLLAGLLVDADGVPLTSDHAVKNGMRYRYYVGARTTERGTGPGQARRRRARYSAPEIEAEVTSALVHHLGDHRWVLDHLARADAGPDETQLVLNRARELAAQIEVNDRTARRASLLALIKQVSIGSDELRLTVHPFSSHKRDRDATSEPNPTLLIARRPRPCTSGESAVLGSALPGHINRTLLKAIARGVTWYESLKSDHGATFRSIAEAEGVTEAYVALLVRQAMLPTNTIRSAMRGADAQARSPVLPG